MADQAEMPSLENIGEEFRKFYEEASGSFFEVLRPELDRLGSKQVSVGVVLKFYMHALVSFIGPIISTAVCGFQDASLEEKVGYSEAMLEAFSELLKSPEFKMTMAGSIALVQEAVKEMKETPLQ